MVDLPHRGFQLKRGTMVRGVVFPCFGQVDKSGKFVVAANYMSGTHTLLALCTFLHGQSLFPVANTKPDHISQGFCCITGPMSVLFALTDLLHLVGILD
jgi:hypothetical protein